MIHGHEYSSACSYILVIVIYACVSNRFFYSFFVIWVAQTSSSHWNLSGPESKINVWRVTMGNAEGIIAFHPVRLNSDRDVEATNNLFGFIPVQIMREMSSHITLHFTSILFNLFQLVSCLNQVMTIARCVCKCGIEVNKWNDGNYLPVE